MKKTINKKYNYQIVEFAKLNSTNSYALEQLAELADRTVVRAERQTAGRGQFKRSWVSDIPDNIYISIILKPEKIDPDKYLKKLTKKTAEAVVETIGKYIEREKISIKLPNDVLVDGKKIAGILTETKFIGSKCLGIVVGIGINLNMPIAVLNRIDQPATSLNLISGKRINKNKFLDGFLEIFFNY